MKYLSRLTALLLAFVLLFSSSVGVIAESDISDLTRSGYDQMVSAAKEAAEAEAAAAAQEAASQPIINEGGVVYEQDIPEQTKRFDIYEVISDAQLTMGGETEITLPQSGKINLNAGTAAQWQIYVPGAGIWVNIAGASGDTLALTYAVIGGMLSGGAARVRAVAGDEAAVANVTVAYGSALPPVEEEAIFPARAASTFSLRRSADAGVMAAADTPELKEYTVVINYVFGNNVVVADPYTATLAAGSSFSATVKHPTVMGYLPYINNETETSESVELNITNIQADMTYTVTYKPTNVNYTVIHYQQNVDNDNYTIAETETKQGLTNSTVLEVAKNYEGFYALLYERPEIAADGSTVVEVYYDRNYYLMNFDLGGGYGVEPIYARYGAPVSVGTPTRPGYTFNSWSPEVPATVPVGGGTYTAQWAVGDTAKVKVVLWGENPNDEEYSYLTTGELMLTPNTKYTYNGMDQLYLYCDQEAHTHDENCGLICGKKEHTTHTDACYKCDHTHKKSCFATGSGYYNLLEETTKPSDITDYSANGVYTYITTTTGTYPWGGSYSYDTTHYYLYVDGTWYCAARERYNGDIEYSDTTEITESCDHTHTDECYACEYHEHTDACYGCGKEEHTHDSNCTGTVAGLDSELWTFVKSDTVTVAADGSSVINVYYDRVSYNVEFHSNESCTDEYDSLRITAKWGENIVDEWPTYQGSSSWLVQGKENTWQNGIQTMPVGGAKFWGPKTGNSSYTAYYYVEALPGASNTVTHNGVTYVLHHTDTSSSSGNVTAEEKYPIEGFTYKEGTANGSSYNNAKFYYTRHKYAIEFYSPTSLLKKTTGVAYQAPLDSYDWTPDATMAPDKYEPGSVKFEGWYLNPECTGEKFDFTKHTMPAGTKDGDTTLTLYAKWVPVNHTVEFYLDKDELTSGTSSITNTHPNLTVPHGSKVETVPVEPNNGAYTFVGWFYMDNGVEKAFDFANMPVNKDLKVYGKWSSNTLKEYTVYFKIQGTDTQIADPITGSGLAGITKTFEAKGGTDLYDGYQEGYFPLVKSHSMTLNIDHEDNADDNTFTFWYVQKNAVPYTVYYVAETLKDGENAADYKTIERDGKTYYIIADTYTNSENRKAVVTEKFKPVTGYMPDAYQKRLVVDGNEGAVNEIIFYYSVDSTHAHYKITHYTQNTDGESWTEYASSQAVGDIGETYTAESLTIDGFTYKADISKPSGTLKADGLELKLYYTRNEYPYVVRYLEQGTGKELAPAKTGTGLYGAVVSESAIGIMNYTAVDPTSQTLTIKIEESQTEAKLNIITFYYTENEVTINYEAVGPAGAENFGSVDPERETLKVLSGTASGSTATAANSAYTFVGWYDNEACTGEALSTEAKYVPAKVDGKNVAATYYAKFEENVVTINYIPVGPNGKNDGSGTVSPTSETVKVLTGTPSSTADPNDPTYKFVGWFKDETCEEPVEESWVEGMTLKPQLVNGVHVATTYYAKFDWNVADLTISKMVTNATGFTPATNTFNFTVALPNGSYTYTVSGVEGEKTLEVTNGSAALTLDGGQTAVIKGVVITSEYSVTETNIPTGFAVDKETKSGTIVAGENLAAFTNTYTTGTLAISKTVEGANIPENAEFTFTVKLVPDGAYTYTVNGGAEQTLTIANGTGTLTLKGGETATINGFPNGATYEVTETDHPDFTQTNVTGATGTIVTGETKTAAFTNTHDTASLTITKNGLDVYAAGDSTDRESAIFTVTVKKGETYNKIFTISLGDEQSATITGLPVGADYTIDENSSWSWRYSDAATVEGTIVSAGNSETITNANPNPYWLGGDNYEINKFN